MHETPTLSFTIAIITYANVNLIIVAHFSHSSRASDLHCKGIVALVSLNRALTRNRIIPIIKECLEASIDEQFANDSTKRAEKHQIYSDVAIDPMDIGIVQCIDHIPSKYAPSAPKQTCFFQTITSIEDEDEDDDATSDYEYIDDSETSCGISLLDDITEEGEEQLSSSSSQDRSEAIMSAVTKLIDCIPTMTTSLS